MDSEPPIVGKPFRSFQVVKTSAMGLGAPQGFAVTIYFMGGTAETPSPAYHTSKMWWTKQRPWLPASFDLYARGSVIGHKIGLKQDAQVAKVSSGGWEGLIGMKCGIDIDAENESIKFVNEIPEKSLKRRLHVKGKGTGRVYEVRIASTDPSTSRTLNWKGTTSALEFVQDAAPSCNGNLKLVSPDHADRLLAVWKNRTDPSILGALHILD
jgi:hypothetical protein